MKSFFEEFKKFALRGNAIDLAVGVVIGAAFNSVTNSLVTNILTPPIGLMMGGIDFASLSIVLMDNAVLHYGLFLQALVNFIITAFALFLLVRFINKLVRLAREDAQKEGQPVENKTPELMVLEEIRDSLRGVEAKPAPVSETISA
ncbi:MAG: large conductance mechanosensitive channel protein MscL [Candidatus Pacebacteria bacterium]|nr:large conductance mechanosensitive channel protein MscL [Candidatus Paceibacterota bacterium]